ncbi:MAG: hypothetical protein PHU25_16555 [Deltaproteobacteria bacterium]|nr:hypothetical protein [Deltaproteobacteria bacterium]
MARLAMAVLISAAAAACGGDCIRHSDCASGEMCVAGECVSKDADSGLDAGPACQGADCLDAGIDGGTDSVPDTETQADTSPDAGADA